MGHLDQRKQGVRSMKSQGNNYVVILYTVDTNHIKSYPIKSRDRSELLRAYNDVYTYLHM
ncbi:hypothetical protein ACHAW6_001347 [Cyclotella cf. meneghiniana]